MEEKRLRSDTPAPVKLVADEATHLLQENRGIGRFVHAVLPRLLAARSGLHLVLFAKNKRDVSELSHLLRMDTRLRERTRVRHIREMRRADADIFWYPWNVARPAPSRGTVVVTMHDVARLAHPDPRWYAKPQYLKWRRRFAATARRATIIVTNSAFTAKEVQRMLAVPPDRIRIALLAADDLSAAPVGCDGEVLTRLRVRQPFVLAVGAAERRKNHAVLDRAMRRVIALDPTVTLVLAGPHRRVVAPKADEPWRHAVGFVSDRDLAVLYRTAAMLVMPSTYEGFGLPVLEAMRLGAPVVCARAASLPEVAGNAAEWVDPSDEAQLAAAIYRVLSDRNLQATMRAAGRSQAARFTWDQTASVTLRAFDEARQLSGGASRTNS